MIETLASELDVSVGVVWALVALAVVQLIVMAVSLVDLARRPRVRFDKKWIWAVVIVFLSNSFIGPILYFALGRNVPEEVDVEASDESARGTDRTRRAVDTLYGGSEDR